MKKILVSLAVALTVSATAYAQSPIQFGVQAGLNLSSVNTDDKGVSSKIGFNAGVTADYVLSETLYLQPALLYTVKGDKEKAAGLDVTNTLSYLELPIMVGYKVPLEGFTVSLKAGPYLAYGLSAKMKNNSGSGELDLYDKNDGVGGKARAKRFDYGLGIGADIQFGKIVVGLAYELGLANLNNISSNSDDAIRNVNSFLSVGYKF
jgi:hypothetical protein